MVMVALVHEDEGPAVRLGEHRNIGQRDRIVGEQEDGIAFPHRTRGAQHWPGAFETACVHETPFVFTSFDQRG